MLYSIRVQKAQENRGLTKLSVFNLDIKEFELLGLLYDVQTLFKPEPASEGFGVVENNRPIGSACLLILLNRNLLTPNNL